MNGWPGPCWVAALQLPRKNHEMAQTKKPEASADEEIRSGLERPHSLELEP